MMSGHRPSLIRLHSAGLLAFLLVLGAPAPAQVEQKLPARPAATKGMGSSATSPAVRGQNQVQAAVAALDLAYQAAVKRNDADAMDKILNPQYALVLGNGSVISREDLIGAARRRDFNYDIQDEDPGTQTVRVWGDLAVVTACLRIKGTRAGQPIDWHVWFSDTYIRTPQGWKYAFAQVSLPLPPKAP